MSRLWLALPLVAGCAGSQGDGPRGDRFAVDCLGMVLDAEGPFGEAARTRTWTYDETTDRRDSRCLVQWPDGATGSSTLDAMRGSELSAAMAADAPFVNLSIVWGGALYNSKDGEFRFEEFEDGKASGTYRVTGTTLGVPAHPVTGPDAIIEGRFDWCDVQRTDCPHRSEVDGLDKQFSVQAPVASGEGQTVYCRVLRDTATQAARVDMQFATWNGINTAELFVDACSSAGGAQPQGNRFELRLDGVTGPGSYPLGDPRRIHAPDGAGVAMVPGYEWLHPAVLQADLPSYQVCASYLRQATVHRPTGGRDGCVATLEADRFVLDCDNAQHGGLGQFGQDVVEGPFRLESDCDWVEL